jgi:hypothetical protein
MKTKLLLLAILAMTFFSSLSFGQRRYYGGGHHTKSHGGTYVGGRGSSHKGGHYRNSSSYNRYGIHSTTRRKKG